jgi:hypothetical protein
MAEELQGAFLRRLTPAISGGAQSARRLLSQQCGPRLQVVQAA